MLVLRHVILYFLLLTLNSVSQTISFEKFNSGNGLLSDDVYNLYQDKKGYIWAFTNYGAMKYNAREFKQVLKNLPLTDSFIYSMFENNKGQKWVANSKGRVFRVINDSAFLLRGLDTLFNDLQKKVSEICQLYADDSLNVFLITKRYSYKLIHKNGEYSALNLSTLIKPDSIAFNFYCNKDGAFSVYNFDGNEHYMASSRKYYNVKIIGHNKTGIFKVPKKSVTGIKYVRNIDNTLYFSMGFLLGKITQNNTISFTQFKSTILDFKSDKSNHIWVACLNEGLYELDRRDSVVNHYFDGVTINCILNDHQNGIWVSTSGNGLLHCKNLNSLYYSGNLATSISFVKNIGEELYIANTIGNVYEVKKNVLTRIRENDNSTPSDILKLKEGKLVALTFGVDLIKQQSSTKTKIEIVAHKLISLNKDTVICLWRRGIEFILKNSRQNIIDFDCKILSGECKDNVLYIGTDDGVFTYDLRGKIYANKPGTPSKIIKDTLTRPKNLQVTQKSLVYNIIRDHFGMLWFCTIGNGVFRLCGNDLYHFTKQQNLPGDIVRYIDYYKDSTLLLCSNKGVFITQWRNTMKPPVNWKNVYKGDVKSATIFEEKLYIGSNEGLLTKDYRGIFSKRHLLFNLNSISVDSKEIDPGTLMMLNHKQNNLAFKFDVIDFVSSDLNIHYSLTGPSHNAGITADHEIRFGNLQPGEYRLEAYPDIPGGNEQLFICTFKIIPAFYQTTYFKILIFIGSIIAIVLLILIIVRYIQKKDAIKTKNEQLILEYKLVALKAQINPHFMSNCLSAIQDLIMNDYTEKATFYIAQFGLLVRNILDYSSKQLISLGEELDLLKIYMELEQLRFENKFIFKIHVKDDISLKDTFVPPLILNPIIENAIWHGILPLQTLRRGELQIIVVRDNENLILSIMDNGIGRNNDKKEISNQKNKSYGIKITEQRLTNINYLYDRKDSRIVYEDLKDENEKPSGTNVTIYLPFNLTPLQNDEY